MAPCQRGRRCRACRSVAPSLRAWTNRAAANCCSSANAPPKQRRLANQSELEEIAAERGFQSFEAHADNHEEQVRRFGEAEIIVAAHGAGLTNLLFARPGATVLELFPEDCVKSSYLWLATRMGINYRALLGEPGHPNRRSAIAPQRFAAGLPGCAWALANSSLRRGEPYYRRPSGPQVSPAEPYSPNSGRVSGSDRIL